MSGPPPGDGPARRRVVDARGRVVMVGERIDRVVSLVPSLTEWLVVIGIGHRLVGVTDWCTEPADVVASLPKVRGTKNPDTEAVKRLRPDLVVANAEENRKIDVERLEAASIPVYVTMPLTVAAAVKQLRDLAGVIGSLPAAAEVDAELVEAVAGAYRDPAPRCVRYACSVWRDPWMWVGRRTYSADLLALAGGVPVLADPATRYPRIEPADVAALRPEIVLLPNEPYAFGEADAAEVRTWCEDARLIDGKALTWYGPRIPAALRELRSVLLGAEPHR